MWKLVFMPLLLVGCVNKSQVDRTHAYNEICLGGVVYYYGHGKLAPKVDPESLNFVRCKVRKKY